MARTSTCRRQHGRQKFPVVNAAPLLVLLLLLASLLAHQSLAGAPDKHDGFPLHIMPYRNHSSHPSPRCCTAAACAIPRTNKHAFVTSVRTARYVPLLRQLVCSLAESNPGQLLIVLGCEGDNLSAEDSQAIADLSSPDFTVQHRLVPDIAVNNTYSARFSLNWVKLSSWSMTEFDSIINLDTDMTVLGDLTHLRTLPTDFAWVPYQGPGRWWNNKGGFVFLRPCQALFRHMVQLVRQHKELQFQDYHAEQTFLDWYFHYTGFRLPMIYNTNTGKGIAGIEEDGRLVTAGGAEPLVLHFAIKKPWQIKPGDPLFKYANRCTPE